VEGMVFYLAINFYLKDPKKSQVVVQHSKLPDARTAKRMKAYWSNALDRLQDNVAKLDQTRIEQVGKG
jgi:hypothetical protein